MLAPRALTPTLHARRHRHALRRRVTPFNLAAAGRGPLVRAEAASQGARLGWLGPWVDLGLPGPSDRGGLGRVAPLVTPHAALWAFWPARGATEESATAWLGSVLRGLTGRVCLKLRFKGKSFRWHRRRGCLVLRFGHSHLVACPPPRGAKWRRHGKAKMIFFHSNLAVLRNFLLGVVGWREPNRYHSRGLRLARQVLVRKAGKVSAYR